VLRTTAYGDVDVGADEAQSAAVGIALDLGDHVDPSCLAIVGPDNAILGSVLGFGAGQRIEEMPQCLVAVAWVDAVDPVFVRLGLCFRRQAMDDEIFWRSTVLKAPAKIDLNAAYLAYALYPRQLRLALLQRTESVVALPGKRLKVLPKLRQCGIAGLFERLSGNHLDQVVDCLYPNPLSSSGRAWSGEPVVGHLFSITCDGWNNVQAN
jgi:hypothetical protein